MIHNDDGNVLYKCVDDLYTQPCSEKFSKNKGAEQKLKQ